MHNKNNKDDIQSMSQQIKKQIPQLSNFLRLSMITKISIRNLKEQSINFPLI